MAPKKGYHAPEKDKEGLTKHRFTDTDFQQNSLTQDSNCMLTAVFRHFPEDRSAICDVKAALFTLGCIHCLTEFFAESAHKGTKLALAICA